MTRPRGLSSRRAIPRTPALRCWWKPRAEAGQSLHTTCETSFICQGGIGGQTRALAGFLEEHAGAADFRNRLVSSG